MSTDLPFGINGYTLSPAEYNDFEFVMDCVKGCILSSVSENERFLSDLWINDIMNISGEIVKDGTMGSEVYILKTQDKRIGFLWMSISKDQFTCDPTGYVLGVFVTNHFRGRGLGKELMRSAEAWCRLKGLITMTLNVGTENKVASDMYSSIGFKPQSTVMKKNLF